MDQLSVSPETADGLKNLSAADRQELNQFVQNETQKAQIQGTVHSLTGRNPQSHQVISQDALTTS